MRQAMRAVAVGACLGFLSILSACTAPPGYHYPSGDFTTPIPNDFCMLSFLNSKHVLDLMNSSVGKPGGFPRRVESVQQAKDTQERKISALGLPTDTEPPMVCSVSVKFTDGSAAKGIFDLYSPPNSSSFTSYWYADADVKKILAAREQAQSEARRKLAKQAAEAGFPPDCAKAHAIERDFIPRVLGLPSGSASIIEIKDLTPTMPPLSAGFSGTRKQWSLQCAITVLWSNGAQDYGYEFTMKSGRYGGYAVTYSDPSG